MTKESWFILISITLVLALLLLVAVKKWHLLDTRPDQKIVYKLLAEKDLNLHVFKAQNGADSSPGPAVLFFHGGGWVFGGAEQFYPQCEYLSNHGFTCLSAQYRLGPSQQPDIRGAIEDARSALEYMTEHAEELHIDPQRIAVGGGSAGGHLAAALGTALLHPLDDTDSDKGLRPAALVLYNPILDFAPGTLSYPLAAPYWKKVSPVEHVDGAIPPTLILVGSHDAEVPLSSVENFCDEVQSKGGHCEVEVYQGQGHGFFNQAGYLEKTNQRVLQFLAAL